MTRKVHLLIIDPQNDFCDLPNDCLPYNIFGAKQLSTDKPALPVPGAHGDMLRLSDMIRKGQGAISDITITLDSHHAVGIERPLFWVQGNGQPVSPFTEITAAKVRTGEVRPRNFTALDRTLAYLDALEAAGRYKLMVWPPHCEIGTWGHNVHDEVRKAYNEWEALNPEGRIVNKVLKGSNPWTEHYSALQAEVPDENDSHTLLNSDLIQKLRGADLILVAGEAGSHCVKATMEHLVENIGTDKIGNVVLLTDCISPVAGFEQSYLDFLRNMHNQGVRVATSVDMLNELVPGTAARARSGLR